MHCIWDLNGSLMMLWLAYISLASQVTQCVPQNEHGIIATL